MPNATPSRRTGALHTSARLSLGRSEPAVSTQGHLRFQLDHALARDAVHTPLDLSLLQAGLRDRGLTPLSLRSAAPDRATYLRRPDLGRTLHPDSLLALKQHSQPPAAANILFLLADGLSALALERHALPLLDAALPLLAGHSRLVPLLTNARVALADPIGQLLYAGITVLLIGERPGLTAHDSLGCYITWQPSPGRTDAERNCISNIRGDAGLGYAEAALRIAHYLREAHRLQTTGTALKDPTNGAGNALPRPQRLTE